MAAGHGPPLRRFAFHWKAFLGRREARSQCAHFCVPLEGVSRRRDTLDSPAQILVPLEGPPAQEALRKPIRANMSSSETHFFASQRHGAAALKPRLHWKAFLGEKTVRSSPSHWNQNLSNEAITSFPRLSAGVDSNRVAPRVSRRRLPQPRFLRRGLSRRETRGAPYRLNLPATRCHQRSSGWQRARRQRRQRRQATPSR